MKFDIKTALETFTDLKGNNPLTAGASLLTFGKMIPFQIFKSVALAFLVFVILLVLIVWLQAPIWLIIIATIVGFCGMIAMTATGILKFITDAFFGNVSELISSFLYPIDKVYDDFRKDERDPNMSKKEFFGKVLQDVVKPKVQESIGKVPYGNKISERLDALMDDIVQDEKFAASAEDDNTPAVNFSQPINSAVRKSAKKINTPFRFVLKWVILAWAVVFLVLLLVKYLCLKF
jgi:hypothetical protein